MLAHLDRRGDVVRAVVDVAVVLQPDVDLVVQAAVGDALLHELELLLRQRDAGDAGAAVLGGVQRERAPPAPDVEQPRARLHVELRR